MVKIHSFNVNGIRAILKKGFLEYLNLHNPDIFCLQETRAEKEQIDETFSNYKYHFWNSAQKKGYSGVAIFSKIEPKKTIFGIGDEKHDNEGRVLTLEFENYYLTTVYTPNSKMDLSRLNYRQKEWDKKFLEFVSNLEKEKPVIFCGDLNVAHKEIDLTNPKTNRRNPGFTNEEREGFDNYLKSNFIDTFRYLNPNKIQYSWWSYMRQARQKNIGWRIDYFLISEKLLPNLKKAKILDQVLGSDHCPVSIHINFEKK